MRSSAHLNAILTKACWILLLSALVYIAQHHALLRETYLPEAMPLASGAILALPILLGFALYYGLPNLAGRSQFQLTGIEKHAGATLAPQGPEAGTAIPQDLLVKRRGAGTALVAELLLDLEAGSLRRGVTTLNLQSLDATTRLQAKKEFAALCRQKPQKCLVNLQAVQWVDSSGLALLIELRQLSLRAGLPLSFINIPDLVMGKLKASGLQDILLVDSPEQAQKTFKTSSNEKILLQPV